MAKPKPQYRLVPTPESNWPAIALVASLVVFFLGSSLPAFFEHLQNYSFARMAPEITVAPVPLLGLATPLLAAVLPKLRKAVGVLSLVVSLVYGGFFGFMALMMVNMTPGVMRAGFVVYLVGIIGIGMSGIFLLAVDQKPIGLAPMTRQKPPAPRGKPNELVPAIQRVQEVRAEDSSENKLVFVKTVEETFEPSKEDLLAPPLPEPCDPETQKHLDY